MPIASFSKEKENPTLKRVSFLKRSLLMKKEGSSEKKSVNKKEKRRGLKGETSFSDKGKERKKIKQCLQEGGHLGLGTQSGKKEKNATGVKEEVEKGTGGEKSRQGKFVLQKKNFCIKENSKFQNFLAKEGGVRPVEKLSPASAEKKW